MNWSRHFIVVAALIAGSFSACDCESTAPGQNSADGGSAATIDGSGVTVDASGVGVDHPGWTVDDGGLITVLADGGVVVTEDGGHQWLCMPLDCLGNGPQACADCEDNDGDGIVDWRDPECLGPCDNTEGPGLDNGVGGTGGNSCGVDCYFDHGNGSGWDDCQWDHRCDELSPENICAYDADFVTDHGDNKCPDVQSDTCAQTCRPITPNGCDCFGCCTFPELSGQGPGGDDVYVWIGNLDDDNNSICTLADLSDPALCPPCTPVGNCLNECGRCEVCVGRPMPPEDCWGPVDAGSAGSDGGATGVDSGTVTPHDAAITLPDGNVIWPDAAGVDSAVPPVDAGGGGQCPTGLQACGLPGQPNCPAVMYCLTGCCVPSEG